MNAPAPRSIRRRPALIALLPALAAIVLYAPAWRLPLIYDTLLHIRIAGDLTLASVWQPTAAFGFYRPLTFLPLILIERLWGDTPSLLLQTINIGQHAVNAGLLSWLAWRVWRSPVQAVAAGVLFAAFPFSYQAVAVYGHNVHPQAVGLTLFGLHAYLSAVRGSGRRPAAFWLATGTFFLLSLLNHESGILFGAFAGFIGLASADAAHGGLRAWLRRQWPHLAPALLFVALGAVYLVIYQFLPISRAPQAAGGEGDVGLKVLYALQALAYPLAPLGRWAPAGAAVLGATAITLGAAISALYRAPWRWLAPLGWWGLASALIVLPLPSDYLLHGPRLLYLGSVGVALLWGGVAAAAWGAARSQWQSAGRAAVVLAVAAIVAGSGWFVRDRLQAYAALTGGVDALRRATADVDAGGDKSTRPALLWLNLPAWTAPAQTVFPVGAELVQQLGPYLFVEEWVHFNLAVDYVVRAQAEDSLLSVAPYGYGVHAPAAADLVGGAWAAGAPAGEVRVFATRYAAEGPETVSLGRLVREAGPAQATFGEAYGLVSAAAGACGTEAIVTLTWRVPPAAAANPGATAFVQLLDADGRLIGQADGPPLGVRPDRLDVPAGMVVTERRTIAFDAPLAADGVLLVGIYDFGTGERLVGVSADGAPLGDDAWRVVVSPDRCPAPIPGAAVKQAP